MGQCAGPFWGVWEQDVCVYVVTGAKNYANHTQYVEWVEVANENGDYSELEAWGQNFYFKGWTTTAISRTIDKWEPSGSGVCGAIDPNEPGDSREVTCITIKV